MSRVLPYNAKQWEVTVILDGRKTVARRYVKYRYSNTEMKMRTDKYGTRLVEIQKDVEGETFGKNPDGSTWHKLCGYIEPKPPYQPGDILYVRETWCKSPFTEHYIYRADGEDQLFTQSYDSEIMDDTVWKWRPSIHMPKEAARIWLKVTDVRVERLQDITEEQAKSEGAKRCLEEINTLENRPVIYEEKDGYYTEGFKAIWNSTIKKSDLNRYGWKANPWVWRIEFEKCEKPEA